jgi:hypothetical protein
MFARPLIPSQSLGTFQDGRAPAEGGLRGRGGIPDSRRKLSSLWPLPRQRVLNPCYTRIKDTVLYTRLTRPWVNPLWERERRGRFLASAASTQINCRRASHKTDRSRGGGRETRKSLKLIVNKG